MSEPTTWADVGMLAVFFIGISMAMIAIGWAMRD